MKIEKNVPMPRRASRFPLDKLKIGDSFVVDLEDARALRVAAHRYTQESGWKFITRTTDKGLRIWRTE